MDKWKELLFLSITMIGFSAYSEEEYDPWYTGPIIATSPNNIAPGRLLVQPYLYGIDTYGSYDSHWHSHPRVDDVIRIDSTTHLRTGITNWLDISAILRFFYVTEASHKVFRFADPSLRVGFQLLKSQKHTAIPSIRLVITEVLPTSKYQKLHSDKAGIDWGGTGSFMTRVALCIGKIVFWIPSHPMSFRVNLSYLYPANVHVRGFNFYGGGFGTKGTVHPSQHYTFTSSCEFSFTQRWVGVMEFFYDYGTKSHFSGTNGISSSGSAASNTSLEGHSFVLAPALEYNFNKDLGVILGAWFTIAGKNIPEFASGVLSVCYIY